MITTASPSKATMYTLREEGDGWNKMDLFLYIFVKMLKKNEK
jgi:hypothetical protein